MVLSFKKLIIILLVVVAALAWQKHSNKRQRIDAEQSSELDKLDFSPEPEQSSTRRAPFSFKGMSIQPLAEFKIRAKILSRRDYSSDAESRLSPLDLALGWQRMSDPAVYKALNITQNGRWFYYSWPQEPPIPPQEIIASAANMHMIPADDAVAQVLDRAKAGQNIKIKGLLVEAKDPNGWTWRSSLTRTDSGGGSCEVIFVEAAEIE